MPFSILSSLQSETNKFTGSSPIPTYNTFNQFSNISTNTQGFGINQNLFGGQTTAISGNGQYILYSCNSGKAQYSSNSGSSFTTLNAGTSSQCVCMSETGERQYVLTADTTAGSLNFWYTTNYTNWVGKSISALTTPNTFGRGMACNYTTGQYVMILKGASTGKALYSADYGATFTEITITGSYTQTGVELSDDGTVAYVTGFPNGGSARVYKSTNLLTDVNTVNPSATFTVLYNTGLAGSTFEICTSTNGQNIVFGGGTGTPTTQANIWVSNNAGSTFTKYTLTANTRIVPAMSRDGKYILVYCLGLGTFYSVNYGIGGFTAMTPSDFIGSNPPTTMNISWYGVAVNKKGDKAIVGTQNSSGTLKLWYGTNTIV